MNEFNSQGWVPYIKSSVKQLYEKTNSKIVLFNEVFVDDAIAEYSKRLPKLKKEIFGDTCPADDRIDRHKTNILLNPPQT